MSTINHQDRFSTNLTSNTTAGATTTPLDSIPSIAAPFYVALDVNNINNHFEIVYVTSKTATNINHAATSYAHTTSEEVRIVIPAAEMNALWDATAGWTPIPSGTTVAYSSADDPTYVVTTSTDLTGSISVGMKMKFTNNSTTFYGFVTAITSGTITLYGGTDYDVANSAITNVSYSSMASPFGFTRDPAKWRVRITGNTQLGGAITGSTWTNLGTTAAQLSVPIGAWDLGYKVNLLVDRSTAGTDIVQKVTLSTANNTESDADFTASFRYGSAVANSADILMGQAKVNKDLTVAAKTLYYLNAWNNNGNNQYFDNANGSMIIEAKCSYL